MKFKDLQKLDQDIIMALSSHKGTDRAIQGKILAQLRATETTTPTGYCIIGARLA